MFRFRVYPLALAVMGRDPCYFRPRTLIEVTCVTIQNRFLLRPSAQLNDLFVGVLGRAQEKYGKAQRACFLVKSSPRAGCGRSACPVR